MRNYIGHTFWLFSTVYFEIFHSMCIFQMLLQFRCVTKSIITMAASLAFYPLCILKCVFETACFSLHLFEFSPLCFQMCPQMPNLKECVIA